VDDPSSACCCYQSGGDDFSHYLIELRALGTSERIYGSNVPLRRGMTSRSGRLLRECAGDHREHEAGTTEDRKDAAASVSLSIILTAFASVSPGIVSSTSRGLSMTPAQKAVSVQEPCHLLCLARRCSKGCCSIPRARANYRLAKGATSNGRGRLLHATMFKGA